MIPFYHPKQVKEVVKSGNSNEFDISEVNGKIQQSSVDGMLFTLEENQIVEYLNYHYDDSNYQHVFINFLFSYKFKNLDNSKQKLVINWIQEKSCIHWTFVRDSKNFFRISMDRSRPFNINTWTNDLHEYILGKDGNEVLRFFEYGEKMLNEEHNLHLIICNSEYDCHNCNQLRIKKERLKVSYGRVKNYLEGQEEKSTDHVKNRIQWKGTQKQLAELLIELKNNNWIEEFDYETIKSCFTKSNSIQQILKPNTDKRTSLPDYDQVYTATYEPRFHGIKSNPKP